MTAIPGALRERLSTEGLLWLDEWLGDPFDESILPRIEFLLRTESFDELADAFSKRLSVGTGGMRGAVGVGPNRFNHETLGRAIQGHANFLRQTYPEHFRPGAPQPVLVLAYDVRVFHDKRGIYEGFDKDDPLVMVSSSDFAAFAAIGYAVNGIRTLMPPADGLFVSTPELSLAIRRGGHLGGINLSASHNHPDDNGIKFYNAAGAQLSGVESDALQQAIWTSDLPDPLSDEDAESVMEFIGEYDTADHDAYIALAAAGIVPAAGESIVYTPLEGVGADSVAEVLDIVCPGYHLDGDAGDGSFDSVPYGLPNPEILAVFGPARELADREGAELILASDPDADRLGAMVKDASGAWHPLTGNQIGALLVEWRCRQLGSHVAGHVLLQTCVTAEESARVAESHGVAVESDLPVGFKFIARAMDAVLARGQRLLLAYEESIGYLLSTELRDKDAAGAAAVLAHAHLTLRAEGSSLLQFYRELNARHGYNQSGTRSIVMAGPEGVAVQEAMIVALRGAGGIPGSTLKLTRDYEQNPGTLLDLSAKGDRAALNILELRGRVAGAETRMCIRRSGTEPKIKLYFEIHGNPDAKLDDVTYESVKAALATAGLAYSRVSHDLPDHIPLAAKQEFAEQIAPAVIAGRAQHGPGYRSPELEQFERYFKGGTLESLNAALETAVRGQAQNS